MSDSTERSRGFLSLTFTSVATAGVSAYLAVTSEAASAYTSMADQAVLATSVAVGTFLAAKLGKRAGTWLGLLGGGTAGAATGATLGSIFSRHNKAENAGVGATLGAAGFGTMFMIAGCLSGFWGGAYLGHTYSEKMALQYLSEKNVTVEQPSNKPSEELQLKSPSLIVPQV